MHQVFSSNLKHRWPLYKGALKGIYAHILNVLESALLAKWMPMSRVWSSQTYPMQYLLEQGLYESQEEAQLREDVLGELDQMIKEWVRGVTEVMGMGEHAVSEASAKLFTFGSYRLGVHGPGTQQVFPISQYCERAFPYFTWESWLLSCFWSAVIMYLFNLGDTDWSVQCKNFLFSGTFKEATPV